MCIRNAMPQSTLCRAHSACSQLSDFYCGAAFAPLYSNPPYNDIIICRRMFAELWKFRMHLWNHTQPHRTQILIYCVNHTQHSLQYVRENTSIHGMRIVPQKMAEFYYSGVVRRATNTPLKYCAMFDLSIDLFQSALNEFIILFYVDAPELFMTKHNQKRIICWIELVARRYQS